jgi:hypothetical protein
VSQSHDFALRVPRLNVLLTTALGLAAFVLMALGCEIAVSNSQTSDYSTGSVLWILIYVTFVGVVPCAITRPWMRRGLGRIALIRSASLYSMVIQLLFLPLLLVIAIM